MKTELPLFIGIDLGTTCCKCSLYGGKGEILAEYNEELPLIVNGAHIEQDAESWWKAISRGIRSILEKTANPPVAAMSVSTQGISFVPVDEEYRPLSNAISWMDRRAEEQVEKIGRFYSCQTIRGITGIMLKAAYSMPKIMWLKDNMPSLFERAVKFLLPLDYVNYKLTGNAVCDYTIAGGTMLFNVNERKWDPRLLELCKISPEKLPRVAPMGSFVGNLTQSAAKELGLSVETKVILGGQDQKLAAIGSGIDHDTVTISMGTASAISVLGKGDLKLEGFAKFALNDEDYIYEASASAGSCVKWLKSALNFESYAEMDRLAEEAGESAGVSFESNFLAGAQISNLGLSHTRGNIVYALYEDICGKIADFASQLEGKRAVKVFGGLSKSEILLKILSKKLQKPIQVLSTSEAGSLGAAILASGGTIKAAKTIKEISA